MKKNKKRVLIVKVGFNPVTNKRTETAYKEGVVVAMTDTYLKVRYGSFLFKKTEWLPIDGKRTRLIMIKE